ncbi:MAG: cell division protein FtsQ/DivIB [Eubacteriales bacterium]|nr:cell division protein FtsQ/DivIB [Eubacteriales bacterium]
MGEYERRSLGKWLCLMVILLVLVLLVSLRLTNITVKGNSRYTAAEVEEMIFPGFWDRNTVFCFVRDRVRPHRELPFVEDYDIQITGPFSCDLVIYEKSVVGFVRFMSSNMYFDKDGVIVESSQERLAGVPEVAGLRFGHIVLNRVLPVSETGLFNEIMNITQQLAYYGIACEKLEFDANHNVRLVLSGGEIEVDLGSGRDTDVKLSALNDMLPKLEGLAGTLDLSEYQDGSGAHVSTFRKKTGT